MRARWVAVSVFCAIAVAVACGDADDEDRGRTSARRDRSTSGGDDGQNDLVRAPGSVAPEDGSWDGDGGGTPDEGGATSSGEGEGAPGDSAAAPANTASPWGSPIAETGRPLPPRRPMDDDARDAYQRGLQAARAGDSATATREFEDALSEDSSAYKAAYNLGVLADRACNERRALQFYRRALRIQADYERAAEGIVTIHIRRGSVPDAVAFIAPLAQRWERNLDLQALYAEVLVHANRLDDAMNAARRALRRDERFVPAMVAIVKASLKRERRELAEAILAQAMRIDQNNAELRYLHGRMLLGEDGRLREALAEFRRAVELRPDYTEARMALGIQLLAGANYREALQQFQAAARLAPTLVQVHLNLADAYRANKMWKQAKTSFDRALRMRAQLPEAHFNMALMYLSAGENYPGLDRLGALQRAIREFTTYRNMMGPRLRRNDASEGYLEDLNRQVKREQKRIERDRARKQRAAERAARQGAEGGGEGGTQ